MTTDRTVSVVTVGCTRNSVDSDELAARLDQAGWRLAETNEADVVVVNTCGFIEPAKKASIDAMLAASGSGAKVVAVGCMAERYGKELAEALPEASAVLSFDDYPEIGERLDDVLEGRIKAAHTPRDRRKLLPLTPVRRRESEAYVPGHAPASGPRVLRHRLGGGPIAPLKLASGCDRRCAFCAIPSFRGAFVSRTPDEIVAEAEWLAAHGVREVILVSENSTSYGKDLGDIRALDKLLPRLAEVVDRVRLNYLQPAELRPDLIEVIASTPGVTPYFDLPFQHASGPVLRRMRRFGDRQRFLELIESIRALRPDAGIRSNFIVGFPGESESDFAELSQFVAQAGLDAIGVFGYSDEEGTEAAGFHDKVPAEVISRRADELAILADEMCGKRAEQRIGTTIEVLVGSGGIGWAEHQAPEVDGKVTFDEELQPGDLVKALVTGSNGIHLHARVVGRSGG
ncbi:30S ribosomal protein S12 methylthiotransferase RimO [Kibdelosporangium philippinense]|uniref:Ribosomal protein uS12 methylthiotransferase RimO n=1 Tax=Kibdelosporangium philippinense TaxID=211113 RepID=A0ABS8Z8Z0_9PSEU|nr:30S ribosomal protein S12 methylthiotransferase RimO [Kibdelosporangium philippinense]MCE7004343.1 30S ribosomal protein S12 methylthiotransferase RimO [Kibdelosporangium philippinense]